MLFVKKTERNIDNNQTMTLTKQIVEKEKLVSIFFVSSHSYLQRH